MKPLEKVVYWVPRIICMLAILFVSLFAADSFSPGLSVWHQIAGFFIHLIPSFILIAILVVAWKWEFWGGLILLIVSLGISPVIFMHNFRMNHSVGMSLIIILMVAFPFMAAGILFVVGHYLKKKNL